MNEINLMSVFQAAQRPESTSKIAKFPTHFRSNIVQKQFRVAPIFESHQKFRRKILVGVMGINIEKNTLLDIIVQKTTQLLISIAYWYQCCGTNSASVH